MVNVDWEQLRIATSVVDDIGDDEASRIYDQLINVEADDEDDPSKLRLLFSAAQTIMQAKAVQAEVAIEELESVTTKFNEFQSKNAARISSVVSDSPGSSKFDRDLERLRSELHEKERQLSHEKRENQRLATRVEDGEREVHNLTRENLQLRDELDEYRKQLVEQNKSFDDEKTSKLDHGEKLREKNRQLNKLLGEIETLETSNANLQSQVVELRDKLHESTLQMDKTTADYIRMKNTISELEEIVEQLRLENDSFRAQMSDLLAQQRAREVADDEIIAAVNQRVDEWKAVLSEKEVTILQLRTENQNLRHSLPLRGRDSDKSTLEILTNAVHGRDNQIQALKVQLENATKELEDSATLLERIKSAGTSGDASDWRLEQIGVLQKRLADVEAKEADLVRRTSEAENHAQERDAEIAEILSRVRQYEAGEYGLSEAVQEIKACKQQIRLRDKQIEELTLSSNRAEFVLGELKEEYEDMCRRADFEPKDMQRLGVDSRKQREKALSEVLRLEVDALEEERIELKQEIRKLAQIVGHRASSYGLSANDAKKLQDYAYKLADRNMRPGVDDIDAVVKTNVLFDGVAQQVKLLQLELEATRENLSERKQQEAASAPLVPVSSEDRHLLNLLDTFRTMCSSVNPQYQSTLLSNVIKTLEKGEFAENIVVSNGMVNVLESTPQVATLSKVIFMSVETQTDVTVQSADGDVRTTTKERTVVTKEDDFVTTYLKGFDEHAEIQQNLFSGTNKIIEDLILRGESLSLRNDVLESERDGFDATLKNHEHCLETLSASPDASKVQLSEMSRKLTVAEVNEKRLLRKCSALMESDSQWRRLCENLQNQVLLWDCSALRRIKYLEQFKEIACFKISSLQRALEDAVPHGELEDMIRKNQKLEEKYKDLLQKIEATMSSEVYKEFSRQKVTVANDLNEDDYDMNALKKRNIFLETQLQSCLEKMQSIDDLGHGAVDGVTAGRVSLLELKELNERQRADHAVALYDEQKRTFGKLKERNDELETRFSQMTKLYGEQQSFEQQLQEELITSVSRKEHDRVRCFLEKSEGKCLLLSQEVSSLKEVAEVAQAQVDALDSTRIARELEEASLRRQLLDLQSGSDEKAVVGKLVRQMIGLQISEASERHKLEKLQTRLQKIEALCLRLEQKCDEKNQTIYNVRNEARTKEIRLKRMIRALRANNVSSSESTREKYVVHLMEIKDYKLKMKQDYKATHELRDAAEQATLELKAQKEQVLELISALDDKDERTQKIFEWHQKMSELRLKEMKTGRQLQRLTQQLEYWQLYSKKQEDTISGLEASIERLQREQDEHMFSRETRETELERTISRLEAANIVLTDDESSSIANPDANLSLADQLDRAVNTIKANTLLQMEQQERCKDLENKLKGEKNRVSELELTVKANNKAIEEMKLDFKTTKTKEISLSPLITEMTNFESTQALKVAQAMVDSLKTRLFQKEVTLSKYEELLRMARDDLAEMAESHRAETDLMQHKDRTSILDALTELKRNRRERKDVVRDSSLVSEQITRMNELEDVAAQQDNVISTLTEKLKAAFKEIDRWQLKVEATAKEMVQEKGKMLEEYEAVVKKLDYQAERHMHDVLSKDAEIDALKKEVEAQIEECKKAPSALAKVALEKLRHQLSNKDKQLQSLSKALTDLKGDLKTMAEENVTVRVSASKEGSVQPSDQAKILQEKLKEAMAEIGHLKTSSRRHNDFLQMELSKTNDELEKQTLLCGHLQNGKERSQAVIAELEAKVRRISRTEELDVLEVETLRTKVSELEEELRACQKQHQAAERPYDDNDDDEKAKAAASKRALALESWESGKRWQQAAAKLKSKLADRDAELTRLVTTVTALKNHVSRLDKENSLLQLRLTEAETKKVVPASTMDDEYHELSRKYFDLQDEMSELKRRNFLEKDVVIEELQHKNESLARKVDDMKTKFKSLTSPSSPKKMSVVLAEELQLLRGKENALEDDILKLTRSNLELRFQVEHSKAEAAILIGRVSHLEKYVDVLKVSSNRSDGPPEPDKLSAVPSSPRRLAAVGVSGKNVMELEKAVNALKKLVIKMQKENAELKSQTQDGGKMSKVLEEENSRLKAEIQELRDRFGSVQSRDAYERGIAKIVSHNERLLRDLQKEVQANEALRIQLHKSKSEVDELRSSLVTFTKPKPTSSAQQQQRSSRPTPRQRY